MSSQTHVLTVAYIIMERGERERREKKNLCCPMRYCVFRAARESLIFLMPSTRAPREAAGTVSARSFTAGSSSVLEGCSLTFRQRRSTGSLAAASAEELFTASTLQEVDSRRGRLTLESMAASLHTGRLEKMT